MYSQYKFIVKNKYSIKYSSCISLDRQYLYWKKYVYAYTNCWIQEETVFFFLVVLDNIYYAYNSNQINRYF